MEATDFPELTGSRPRRIYVQRMDQNTIVQFQNRGYDPVNLMALPRGGDDGAEETVYLYAKLQAMEEGTIEWDELDRKALELALKAHGCLDAKRTNTNLNVSIDAKTAEGLLDWKNSRHTLRGTSTVQNAQFKLEENAPGK
jgi:hypothetical protein